ncbi:MAG: hypothetical protein A2Y33_15400 [Spirochaetes bacterium GWF1_51_8]|nr:MAG: hypothetical protein A2Y33_15400 [Spirochaetes bacterium GWF1_51_8]
MPFSIDFENNSINIKCENVMSLWSLLKELVETPYLKSYVIENYEGGNTLVPRSAWNDDGAMYREISEDIYLFPYESIGFVFDDTLSNVDIYVIDDYSAGMNYKNDYLVMFSVRNVDRFSVKFRDRTKLSTVLAYYLLSALKMRFDAAMINTIDVIVRSSLSFRKQLLELIVPSVTLGLSEMEFVLKSTDENNKSQFIQISCGKRCRKRVVSEKDFVNLGYLKKKLIANVTLLKILYYVFLCSLPVALYIFLVKVLDMSKMRVFLIFGVLGLGILARFIYLLYKRNNIYKHYLKKIRLEQFKEES